MANTRIRIKLKAYEHKSHRPERSKNRRYGEADRRESFGTHPPPTEKEIITILRAPHKYKGLKRAV